MNLTYPSLRTITKIILLVAISISGCKEDTVATQNISVMTYNVAGLPQVLSSSNPETYTSSISKLLDEYAIIHVQEDFCYHDSLLLFDNHKYVTESTGCVPDGDGINTFSNFPISNIMRFPWDDCTGADCFTPKGFYYSQIELLDGQKVDFYNVHCNAGSSVESLAARRKNIVQVCNHMTQYSQGKPIIIMGDFNSRYTRDGDTVRAFFDFGLKDLWIEMVRAGNVPEISPDKLKECDPDRTGYDCERVDKIYYRSSDNVKITPTMFRVDDERFYFQGNDTLPLSDHWPMFANFTIELK